MFMEGTLPPGIKGGILGIVVTSAGPLLVGNVPTAACTVVLGPLARATVTMGGKDVGPLSTIPLCKGSKCTPSMGIDWAVNKFNSEW